VTSSLPAIPRIYAAIYRFSPDDFTPCLAPAVEMSADISTGDVMFGKSFLRLAGRAAARFVRADRGNVAVIFAIALVPMLGIIGAAVDYSRAVAARSAMQAALDTAALMVAKDAQADPKMTSEQATAAAQKYFKALYTGAGADTVTITAIYTANTGSGSSIQVTGSGSIGTDLIQIVGLNTISIGASSTTEWGNVRMRVAMALDNTGSMLDDGKMPALKTASKNLVDQLSALAKVPGDVYISIIPFAKDVNVGRSNYNKPWIQWSGRSDTWDEKNGSCSAGSSYKTKSSCEAKYVCSNSGYTSKNACLASGGCSNSDYTTESACTSAYVCSKPRYTTQSTCTANRGTWSKANYTWTPPGVWTPATWTPASHSTWNGCVMDRDKDYDTLNTAPITGDTGNPSTLFPAEQWSSCPVELVPLTYDWDALKTKIDTMTPSGNTNQSIGLAWAWQSLSLHDPLNAAAKDSSYTYRDAIILLSDGMNTQNRTTTNQSQIDARQKIMCDKAKEAGIIIYTVQVNTGKPADPTSSVLQYCASSSDKFYLVTAASQTVTVFESIGISLSKLRISK